MRWLIKICGSVILFAFSLQAFAQDTKEKKIEERKAIPIEDRLKMNLEFYKDRENKVERKALENYLYKSQQSQSAKEASTLLTQENMQKQQFTAEAKALSIAIAESEEKKIRLYGPSPFDSRIELRQLNPLINWQNNILNNARSVGLLVLKDALHSVNDSIFELSTVTLKKKYNLCSSEPFGDQPVAGTGTVFLVNDSTAMTAAHVLTEPIDKYAIIFGFEIENKQGVFSSFINVSNVYYLNKRAVVDRELDVTLLFLKRKTERKSLTFATSDKYAVAAEVYMIGHPSGLPLKVALNAEIQKKSEIYFYTSLDAFQGNSGAPVFSRETNEVLGILVSGNTDFRRRGTCYISTLCKYPYCDGEKVLKSNVISHSLLNKIR